MNMRERMDRIAACVAVQSEKINELKEAINHLIELENANRLKKKSLLSKLLKRG